MSFFVRAKHWQLFMIMVVVPILFYMVMAVVMVIAITKKASTDIFPQILFVYLFVVVYLVAATQLWQYNVTRFLYLKLPRGVQLNFTMFKAALIFIVIVAALLVVFIAVSLSMFFITGAHSDIYTFAKKYEDFSRLINVIWLGLYGMCFILWQRP